MPHKYISRLGLLLSIILGSVLIYLGLSFVFTHPPQVVTTTATPLFPTSAPEHSQAMRLKYRDDVANFKESTHYWMDLTLEEDPVRITGHERVRYFNVDQNTLDAIVFRIYLNSLAGKTVQEISNISVDGQAVHPEWANGDSVLRIPLRQSLQPGKSVEITLQLAFEFTPDIEINYGRLANRDGVLVLSAFFPLLSIYEKGDWWTALPALQGDPAYSAVALFDVTLTAPDDLKLASTGVTLASADLGNGTTKHTIITGLVRDFSLAMSRDFELLSAKLDDVTINIWSAPGNGEADQFALEKTLASLSIFDEQFGAYPLAELDVVEAPITVSGIEYPGLVYLASNIWKTGDDFFEVVISHEVSHQWWYSMVGNNQVEQPWVDESLADYSVEVYYREAYGEKAGESVRDQYQGSLDQYLAKDRPQMPVGLPVSAYEGYQYGVFVYATGALLYSHLYDDYDPAQLHSFLRAYYGQYRYRIAHTEDLRRMISVFFGTNAEAFFDRWVYGN